jgi:hypothetical protein
MEVNRTGEPALSQIPLVKSGLEPVSLNQEEEAGVAKALDVLNIPYKVHSLKLLCQQAVLQHYDAILPTHLQILHRLIQSSPGLFPFYNYGRCIRANDQFRRYGICFYYAQSRIEATIVAYPGRSIPPEIDGMAADVTAIELINVLNGHVQPLKFDRLKPFLHSRLVSLNLEFTVFKPHEYKQIAALCPNLRELILPIVPQDLQPILDMLKQLSGLQSLILSSAFYFPQLTLSLPSGLLALTLDACDGKTGGVTDRDLIQLAKRCPLLRVFKCLHTSRVTDAGVIPVIESCSGLRKLCLNAVPITDALLSSIRRLSDLATLNLNGCLHITERGLLSLFSEKADKEEKEPALSTLEKLYLNGIRELSGGSLRRIAESAPQLTHIRWDDSQFDQEATQSDKAHTILYFLGRCPHMVEYPFINFTALEEPWQFKDKLGVLTELDLSDLSHLFGPDETENLICYVEQILKCTPKVSSFTAPDESPPEIIELVAAYLPLLDRIDIQDSPGIGAVIPALLRSNLGLTSIALNGCGVTDQELEAILQASPYLIDLELIEAEITDKSLAGIGKHCRFLKALDLSECTTFSDDGLAHLKSCHYLCDLELEGCKQITTKGFQALADLFLENLNVSGTKVVARDLAAILQSSVRLTKLSCSDLLSSLEAEWNEWIPYLSSVREWDFSSNPITLNMLIQLGPHATSLEHVELMDCLGLTQEMIAAFARTQSGRLRTIATTGTVYTQQQIRALAEDS